jgi:hypothetical protein
MKKYIILNNNHCVLGTDIYHQELAKASNGEVTSAGHFRFVDGHIEVFGESVGFNMKAKPEDAKLLEEILGIEH